ncbi:hypothetical protein [Ensifer adhaerens]|uniref:DUF7940 domain-containing protein n=1 Tax=Ensifer adhaerens TaxID=106592 RepID=UPI001319F2BD|nr:hypothetical protein [Ensifer adhaerens]
MIEDWKTCHRLYSQRVNAAGAAIGSAYVMFYDQLRDMLPARHLAVLTVVLFAANCVARIIKQEPKHGPRS